ncbi:hypothetical protein CALVIDRAFT_538863 [Calocera viscosa TUFC12733]|uniref:ABM domain-containing protein n=1 Tax=Calocera viscosa (strain TUFC12733) TaxID=1330018 RepID=A0A167KL57_CALVF|nr:hypothetical protein CALVIDRAFT_538863 [Calocera viscosa TUFC12733]
MVSDYSGLGWTVGRQKEDPSKLLVFVGWNSVEQHMEFRASGDKGWNNFVAKFGTLSAQYFERRDMFHIKPVKIGESV